MGVRFAVSSFSCSLRALFSLYFLIPPLFSLRPLVFSRSDVLAYAEDPCGAEAGFSGREILAEFKCGPRLTHTQPQNSFIIVT
jgi:hypothetical protein